MTASRKEAQAAAEGSANKPARTQTERDPLSSLPPLSYLAVLAALSSMLINRFVIPALSDHFTHKVLLNIVYCGQFATNLAGTAGLFALSVALIHFIRNSTYSSLRRRLFIACIAGIFLPTIFIATFFSRERTTIQIVLLSTATANILVVVISMNALRYTRQKTARLSIFAFANMALFALASQVYQLAVQHHLDTWHLTIVMTLRGIGEFSYLILLMAFSIFIFPRGIGLRDQFARMLAIAVFGISTYGFNFAQHQMGSDFTLILYNAQRVSCLIDTYPIVYALPLCMGLAVSVATLLGTDKLRAHAGLGMLLLLTAGYAPRVPERLLTTILAMMIVVFAIMAMRFQGVKSSDP